MISKLLDIKESFLKSKSGGSILPVLLIFSLLYFYSCKHDPELTGIVIPVDTTGNNNGGTTGSVCSKDTVYFVQAVLPMFQSSCAMSGCHDAITHKEGLRLDSYAGIISGGINVSNPTNSKIYRVLVSTGENKCLHLLPQPCLVLNYQQSRNG